MMALAWPVTTTTFWCSRHAIELYFVAQNSFLCLGCRSRIVTTTQISLPPPGNRNRNQFPILIPSPIWFNSCAPWRSLLHPHLHLAHHHPRCHCHHYHHYRHHHQPSRDPFTIKRSFCASARSRASYYPSGRSALMQGGRVERFGGWPRCFSGNEVRPCTASGHGHHQGF